MTIREALTDDDVRALHPVMVQLRPHVDDPEALVAAVGRMRADGYRLVMATDPVGGAVEAVAGFRVFEMLYRGRFLYVDDLVTDEAHRSKGHGAALLAWLREEARRLDCQQVVLDSGVQRKDAHRFYEREGFEVLALNFTQQL
ncbi:MAG: GNAT family N-acetyltransferase [Thermoplasmatota archaeon]